MFKTKPTTEIAFDVLYVWEELLTTLLLPV